MKQLILLALRKLRGQLSRYSWTLKLCLAIDRLSDRVQG